MFINGCLIHRKVLSSRCFEYLCLSRGEALSEVSTQQSLWFWFWFWFWFWLSVVTETPDIGGHQRAPDQNRTWWDCRCLFLLKVRLCTRAFSLSQTRCTVPLNWRRRTDLPSFCPAAVSKQTHKQQNRLKPHHHHHHQIVLHVNVWMLVMMMMMMMMCGERTPSLDSCFHSSARFCQRKRCVQICCNRSSRVWLTAPQTADNRCVSGPEVTTCWCWSGDVWL